MGPREGGCEIGYDWFWDKGRQYSILKR
jgi:hypothetical protein